MLPAGVATSTPSQTSSGMRQTPSISIASEAACRVSRKIETSLMASALVDGAVGADGVHPQRIEADAAGRGYPLEQALAGGRH